MLTPRPTRYRETLTRLTRGLEKLVKICFWSTSFQADNQALATYLTGLPNVEVWVAMDDPAGYVAEPVNALLPLRARLLDRRENTTLQEVKAWSPEVLIVDNHLPSEALCERVFVLWHGFGWRVDDLSTMRKQLRKLVGDVTVPNPRFGWQAFGAWDRNYRIEHSQLDPANVHALGSAYADVLREGSDVRSRFRREDVASHYDIDVQRPTVLLGLSWHHGGALGHWGDDALLHERLVQHIGAAGGNVLIRMHDRHRYASEDVARMEALATKHQHVGLKFKSESPDSLIDVLLSDVMISNYSSFLNAFYYTGRPTIHIDPMAGITGAHVFRQMKRGKLRVKKVSDPLATWKLSPDDIGGLRAQSFDELLSAVDTAMGSPSSCKELSAAFIGRHVSGENGATRQRITEHLRQWISGGSSAG